MLASGMPPDLEQLTWQACCCMGLHNQQQHAATPDAAFSVRPGHQRPPLLLARATRRAYM